MTAKTMDMDAAPRENHPDEAMVSPVDCVLNAAKPEARTDIRARYPAISPHNISEGITITSEVNND